MSKKIRETVERVEKELRVAGVGTMGSQFAQFITDLWTLVEYVKKKQRRKHV